MTFAPVLTVHADTPAQTADLAERLAPRLRLGDVVLLRGGLGAGKSHFARALIKARLAALGRDEDVPSPTYTLVQSYDLDIVELLHADLYRLSDPQEVFELGLDQAFDTAICLIEWPERLGDLTPRAALEIMISQGQQDEARAITFCCADGSDWAARLADLVARPVAPGPA